MCLIAPKGDQIISLKSPSVSILTFLTHRQWVEKVMSHISIAELSFINVKLQVSGCFLLLTGHCPSHLMVQVNAQLNCKSLCANGPSVSQCISASEPTK